MRLCVLAHQRVPVLLEPLAARHRVPEVGVDLVRDDKTGVRVAAKKGLDAADALRAEGGAVGLGFAGHVAADADDGADVDEGGLVDAGFRFEEGAHDAFNIITAVLDVDDVPPARAHLGVDVFRVAEVDAAVAGDLVVVVRDDQVVQLPVTGQLDGLHGDALLETGVADHAVRHVVDQFKTRPVVHGGEVLRRHGEADGVCDALAQRSRGDFDAVVLNLRVARGEGVGAGRVVRLELVKGHVRVADEVEECVLEEARVAVGEDEAVAVEVGRVGGGVVHDVFPEGDADGSHAHCAAGHISECMYFVIEGWCW